MGGARYLILHGWQGSSPEHWQSWLARRLGPEAAYPALPDPDRPRLAPWMARLHAELRALTEDPVVLCHSLGCVLWLHHVAAGHDGFPRPARVLLVAPPGGVRIPELAEFLPAPLDAGAVAAAAGETRLVCSDDDPYCPGGAARRYGEPLGVTSEVIEGGAHLNTDAGYGPWPAVEAWARGERPSIL
ncbi:MAG: alpha/beta hydrolase [Actinomycetota bacterium]|nr:alpha/beta hydrolase [Actinomycetota bacterium]